MNCWKTLLFFNIIILISSGLSSGLEWSSSSDWDAGSSQGVVHESFGDNNAEELKLGWTQEGKENSLTGYWPMDEDSGAQAADVSGSGNDGDVGNVDMGRDGVFGTSSYEFNGDGIIVNSPNELPTGDTAFSTVFWFKNINANDDGGIIHWGSNSASSANGQEVRDDGWQHYFYSNDRNCYNLGMWDGNWHMAVVTYDTSTNTLKMYLDAQLECSGDAGNVNIDNTDIQIGNGDSSDALNGARLDEVRIWNRKLESKEIEDLYQSVFQGETNTSWKKFGKSVSPSNLELEKVNSSLNGQKIKIKIHSDTDGDGEEDEVSDSINLNGSGGPYKVSGLSTRSSDFRVSVNLESSSASDSPVLKGLRLKKNDLEICDRRGPINECISNSTHNISGENYNIQSIFQSEPASGFEAFSGKATLNITNSSTISGLWKGSFDIKGERPRIVSGAHFRPQNGRIVIGN